MTAVPVVLFSLLAVFFTYAAGYHFGIQAARNHLGLNTRPLAWHQCESAMLAALAAVCCWILAGYSVAKVWP